MERKREMMHWLAKVDTKHCRLPPSSASSIIDFDFIFRLALPHRHTALTLSLVFLIALNVSIHSAIRQTLEKSLILSADLSFHIFNLIESEISQRCFSFEASRFTSSTRQLISHKHTFATMKSSFGSFVLSAAALLISTTSALSFTSESITSTVCSSPKSILLHLFPAAVMSTAYSLLHMHKKPSTSPLPPLEQIPASPSLLTQPPQLDDRDATQPTYDLLTPVGIHNQLSWAGFGLSSPPVSSPTFTGVEVHSGKNYASAPVLKDFFPPGLTTSYPGSEIVFFDLEKFWWGCSTKDRGDGRAAPRDVPGW